MSCTYYIDSGLGFATGGGGAAAAGSTTWIQYNNAGAFGASTNFTFDPAVNKFTVTLPTSPAQVQFIVNWNVNATSTYPVHIQQGFNQLAYPYMMPLFVITSKNTLGANKTTFAVTASQGTEYGGVLIRSEFATYGYTQGCVISGWNGDFYDALYITSSSISTNILSMYGYGYNYTYGTSLIYVATNAGDVFRVKEYQIMGKYGGNDGYSAQLGIVPITGWQKSLNGLQPSTSGNVGYFSMSTGGNMNLRTWDGIIIEASFKTANNNNTKTLTLLLNNNVAAQVFSYGAAWKDAVVRIRTVGIQNIGATAGTIDWVTAINWTDATGAHGSVTLYANTNLNNLNTYDWYANTVAATDFTALWCTTNYQRNNIAY